MARATAWLLAIAAAILAVNAQTDEESKDVDLCARQPFRGTCPRPGGGTMSSQFVLRYYWRVDDNGAGECVSYPFGHCKGTSDDLYRYKEDCEQFCGGGRRSVPSTTRRPSRRTTTTTTTAATTTTTRAAIADSNASPCVRARATAATANIRGGFAPECNDDGSFKSRQCNPTTGQCFCVDESGVEIPNSRALPTQGLPDCEDITRLAGSKNTPTPSCSDPIDIGPCRASIQRFYFNAKTNACERFTYGGCGGNGNNYASKTECESRCRAKEGPKCPSGSPLTTSSDALVDCLVQDCPANYRCAIGAQSAVCCPDNSGKAGELQSNADTNPCEQKKERGSCDKYELRFYFNKELGECKYFFFGGCEGNANNFESLEACETRCGAKRTGGSPGNIGAPASGAPATPASPAPRATAKPQPKTTPKPQLLPPDENAYLPGDRCSHPQDTGTCAGRFTRFFFDGQKCTGFTYSGCGGNGNNFATESECQTACGQLNRNICLHPQDRGPCNQQFTRYWYNAATNQCDGFEYGGCGGNGNNFASADECNNKCVRSDSPAPTPVAQPAQPVTDPVVPPAQPRCPPVPRCDAPCRRGINPNTNCPGCQCPAPEPITAAPQPVTPPPAPECGANERFSECGSACPEKCSGQAEICTLQCVIGCECAPGFVRHDDTNACVPKSSCPAPRTNPQPVPTRPQPTGPQPGYNSPLPTPTTQAYQPPVPAATTQAPTGYNQPAPTPAPQGYGPSTQQAPATAAPANGYGPAPNPQPAPAQPGYGGQPIAPRPVPAPATGYGSQPVAPVPAPAGGYGNQPVAPVPAPAGGYGNQPVAPVPAPAPAPYEPVVTSMSQVHPMCHVPKASGSCNGYNPMWYFNQRNMRCEQMVFTGCGGNTNRFNSKQDCQNRCMMTGQAPSGSGGYGPTQPVAPQPTTGYGPAPAQPQPTGGYGQSPAQPQPTTGYGPSPVQPQPTGYGQSPVPRPAPTTGGYRNTPTVVQPPQPAYGPLPTNPAAGYGSQPTVPRVPAGPSYGQPAPAAGGYGGHEGMNQLGYNSPAGGYGGAQPAPVANPSYGAPGVVGPANYGSPAQTNSYGSPAAPQPQTGGYGAQPVAPQPQTGGYGAQPVAPQPQTGGYGAQPVAPQPQTGGYGSQPVAPQPTGGYGGASAAPAPASHGSSYGSSNNGPVPQPSGSYGSNPPPPAPATVPAPANYNQPQLIQAPQPAKYGNLMLAPSYPTQAAGSHGVNVIANPSTNTHLPASRAAVGKTSEELLQGDIVDLDSAESPEVTEAPLPEQCVERVDDGRECRLGERASKEQVRYYFDKISRRCKLFIYRGCGGNANRFDTRAQCMKTCA